MAGDWIKMRTNLWDDPRVARLCDLTDQSEAAVIGGLYWLWAMADEHTEDGILPGLTCRAIDRKTGVQGLGTALCEVGWLADHPEGVRIVGFEEHNGASAKKRCQTAKRVAAFKAGNGEETQEQQEGNAPSVTETLPERDLEKRREEKNSPSLRSGESAPRATRKCPASFEITPDLERWAAEHAAGVNLQRETDKFRDHTFKTAHSDWSGAWRNWIRKAAESLPRARASPGESFRERDARLERERYAELTGKRPGLDENTIDMPGQLALEHER